MPLLVLQRVAFLAVAIWHLGASAESIVSTQCAGASSDDCEAGENGVVVMLQTKSLAELRPDAKSPSKSGSAAMVASGTQNNKGEHVFGNKEMLDVTKHKLHTQKDEDGLPPVLMHYMPWFTADLTHLGSHWKEDLDPSMLRSQNKVASHLAPLIGPYSNSNRTVLRYHLELMKAAGVKGVIVNWYGTRDGYYDSTSSKVWRYDFADPNLIGSDALVEEASAAGMLFTVCYEDWTLVVPEGLPWGEKPSGALLEQALAQMRKDFEYVRDRYMSLPGFLKESDGGATGRPVFLTFGPRNMKDKSSWTQTFTSVFPEDDQPRLITLYGTPQVGDGMFSWVPVQEPNELQKGETTVLGSVSTYLNRFYDSSLPTPGASDGSGEEGGSGAEWQKHEGKNCWPGGGATAGGQAQGEHSESSCKALCAADDACDCIVLASNGNCWPRSNCQIEQCADVAWADVFLQHKYRISVGSIFPGYHDFYEQGRVNGKSYGRLPDYEGRTFDTAAALAKSRSPLFIQAVTWNDFEEGTCFEPAFGRPTPYTFLLKLQEFILGAQDITAFENVLLASELTSAAPPQPEWPKHKNKNCFVGAGAGQGGEDHGKQSEWRCKELCSEDAACDCIVLAKSGTCWSRSDCQVEQCLDADWADVFVKPTSDA